MADKKNLRVLEESILAALAELIDLDTAGPEEIATKFSKVFNEVKDDCQESAMNAYLSAAPKMLQNLRRESREFEKRNLIRWKPCFDHLEMMWFTAQELGEIHGTEIQAEGGEDDNEVVAALAHLFPRALLVTQEIICLLKGGYPDGALARWRSLHEVSVTAMYIAQVGKGAAIAYLLSFHFAARRAAHQMNHYSERARLRPFSAEELANFDERCERAEQFLGRKIDKDKLGEWPAIMQTHPTFAALEEHVNMDHWRPRYKWASTHTHANHRPADKLLGLSEAKEYVNLIGPSNSGFVDPFQMTAITLAQITTTYLFHTPNPDRIVHSGVMLKLADQMSGIALETEQRTLEDFKKRKMSENSAR
ncbi:hypothetical protein FHG66_20195 [Rubellimicrobium rubrum]|uniref:Uncharacterized protein n=1 Tax=Rubellimicrobium rubrum TaxID=2585369 RepID=A0A5C4MPT3_9RHOB|nr:DUF5677 domain-containing protein [Rubellimicrobium rubrum]TNC45272.1 hypothetical protein FHG66_20195 [Rubellimicrobium rubrum]